MRFRNIAHTGYHREFTCKFSWFIDASGNSYCFIRYGNGVFVPSVSNPNATLGAAGAQLTHYVGTITVKIGGVTVTTYPSQTIPCIGWTALADTRGTNYGRSRRFMTTAAGGIGAEPMWLHTRDPVNDLENARLFRNIPHTSGNIATLKSELTSFVPPVFTVGSATQIKLMQSFASSPADHSDGATENGGGNASVGHFSLILSDVAVMRTALRTAALAQATCVHSGDDTTKGLMYDASAKVGASSNPWIHTAISNTALGIDVDVRMGRDLGNSIDGIYGQTWDFSEAGVAHWWDTLGPAYVIEGDPFFGELLGEWFMGATFQQNGTRQRKRWASSGTRDWVCDPYCGEHTCANVRLFLAPFRAQHYSASFLPDDHPYKGLNQGWVMGNATATYKRITEPLPTLESPYGGTTVDYRSGPHHDLGILVHGGDDPDVDGFQKNYEVACWAEVAWHNDHMATEAKAVTAFVIRQFDGFANALHPQQFGPYRIHAVFDTNATTISKNISQGWRSLLPLTGAYDPNPPNSLCGTSPGEGGYSVDALHAYAGAVNALGVPDTNYMKVIAAAVSDYGSSEANFNNAQMHFDGESFVNRWPCSIKR
jgi:hypothetical protein